MDDSNDFLGGPENTVPGRPARRGDYGQPDSFSDSDFDYPDSGFAADMPTRAYDTQLSDAIDYPESYGYEDADEIAHDGQSLLMNGLPGESPAKKPNFKLIGIIAGALLIVVLAVVLIVRFAGGEPAAIDTPTPTPTPSQTPTPTPTPTPAPVVVPTWPLTGVPGEIIARPSVAVKIENSKDARPQQGLEFADIVYEEMVEGGISRLIAVYNSQYPTEIYPVRSIRPMDGPIMASYGGVIAFSGGQTPFINTASSLGLTVLSEDAGSAGFSRIKAKRAPHNVAGNVETFAANSASQTAPPPQFKFANTAESEVSTAQSAGTPGSTVRVVISPVAKPHWTFDAASGTWLRFEGDTPAMRADGVQLAAMNVVVLSVQVQNTPYMDAAGSYVPESIVVGTGSGLVATGGHTIPVTWSKASEKEPTILTDASGQEVKLAPGNTWVELVPAGSGSFSVE